MPATISLDSAAVLAAARADRRDADAAQARLLTRVAEWADLHRVVDPETEWAASFGDPRSCSAARECRRSPSSPSSSSVPS